ncbi:MAG: hypothetical protein WA866_21840, partial [Pseudolabrys sp.]
VKGRGAFRGLLFLFGVTRDDNPKPGDQQAADNPPRNPPAGRLCLTSPLLIGSRLLPPKPALQKTQQMLGFW